jgi:pyruvate dehydrogenase E2 component (dihydrolipoamide acetyltransferase)
MSERVSMPALGESVTEGTVTRWLKSVGDQVEVDEPLVEVSTDKVDTEIPSPVAGTLQEILAEEDETVEVGADLCVIGEGDAAPSDSSDEGSSDASADEPDEEPTDAAEPQEQADEAEESADEAVSEDTGAEKDQSASGSSGSGSSSGGSGGGGGGETVTMPALGESVTEGTVTRWLKAEGDQVEVDEPLLEVSTDKVDTEIPSPVAGVLTKILVGEDETVEVGGELAVIGGDGGSGDSSGEEQESSSEQPEPEDEDDLGSEQRLHDEAGEEAAAKSEAPGSQEQDKPAEADKPKQEAAPAKAEQEAPKQEAPKQEAPKQESSPETSGGDAGKDVSAYVTPLVRKLAAQHDVDLSSLEGTGVGGRIRKQDVLEAAKKAEAAAAEPKAEAAPAAPEEKPAASAAPSASPDLAAKRGKTEKMSRLRKVIATRMVESLQTSAQLTTVIEVDVTKVARLRGKHKNEFLEREGVKLSFMPFFAMAAIEALKQHPSVNAQVDGDQVIYHAQENLGVAVDTERGLLVPVIKDAGDLNIAGLARKIADLAERTRTNKITPDELGGGTFTLTNTGSRGALFDTPIINQPQVAVLGTGAVVRRPVVVVDEDGGETIAIRSMVYLALTYDHRLVDGADAARFLGTMKQRLEEASFEV